MVVACISDSTLYQLRGGITNSDWHKINGNAINADTLGSAIQAVNAAINGTANYLVKYTGTHTTGNSPLYTDGGKVIAEGDIGLFHKDTFFFEYGNYGIGNEHTGLWKMFSVDGGESPLRIYRNLSGGVGTIADFDRSGGLSLSGNMNIAAGKHYQINGVNVTYSDVGAVGGSGTIPASSAGWLHDNGSGTRAWSTPGYSDVGALPTGAIPASSAGWLHDNGSGTRAWSTPSYSDVGADVSGAATSAVNAAINGTSGYLVRHTGAHTTGNSILSDNGTNIGLAGNQFMGFASRYTEGNHGNILYNSGTVQNLILAEIASSVYAFGYGASAGVAPTSVLTLDLLNNRVGVAGITAPGYKLDVNGSINIPSGANYKINGTNLTYSDVGASPALSLTTGYIPKAASATTLGNSPLYTDGTSVGIGTTGPDYKLSVVNGSDIHSKVGLDPSALDFGKVEFGTGGSFIGYDYAGDERMVLNSRYVNSHYEFKVAGSEKVRIDNAGYVGIGTASPTALLHLYGAAPTMKFDAGGGHSVLWTYNPGTGGLRLSTGNDYLFGDGQLSISSDDATLYVGDNGGAGVGLDASGVISIVGSSTYIEGKLGINNASATHMLDLESSGGGYYSATDHQFHNGSTRAIKDEIHPCTTDVLKILNNLKLYNYKYKTEKDTFGVKATMHMGFIADEAPVELTGIGKDGMATGDAINFCLASLKKLNEKIDSLQLPSKSEPKREQSNNAATAGLLAAAALGGGLVGSKLNKKKNGN
jgi:hypothetical protein